MGFWDGLFGSGGLRENAEKQRFHAGTDASQDAGRAAAIRSLFERALGNEPPHTGLSARRQAAFQLLMASQPALAREAWLSISRDFPHELAHSLVQAGLCYHLEKHYRHALECYEGAIRVGADASQLADNIATARQGMAGLG